MRPLTLLNLDYKIIAKLLATRMKSVLPSIIGSQQTGFMEGRNISENIRKTLDILAYARNKRKRWLVLTIDFEKCFDRISYSGIFGALKYFNFGPAFTRWCKLFFTKFSIRTQNNGYISDSFFKSRSINQGCPVSPYLFLLCSEIMTHELYNHDKIHGVQVEDVKILISQFADDTALFINFCQDEIDAVLEVFAHIEANLGLKISYEKTTVYRIGSLRNTAAKLYTAKELTWSDSDIELLGVQIPNGDTPIYSDEKGFEYKKYDNIVSKASSTLKSWKTRSLTLMGRVLILNVLIASLFIYSLTVLPFMTKKQLKILDRVIQNFLWGTKRAKIPMKLLQCSRVHGGLKLFNLNLRQKALHLQWIAKFNNSNVFDYSQNWFLYGIKKEDKWKVCLNAQDAKNIIKEDTFWKHVYLLWTKYNYPYQLAKEKLTSQFIWYNSKIRINGQPFLWKNAYEAGIVLVQDLIDTNGKFHTYNALCTLFPNGVTWLQYEQLKS